MKISEDDERRAVRSAQGRCPRFLDFGSSRASGSTLLEVVVALGLAIVFVSAVGTALCGMQTAFTEGATSATAEDTVRRTLDRIVFDLRKVQGESVALDPAVDARSITYVTVEGWDGSAPVLSSPKTLSFDSGQVLLDGVVVADGIQDIVINSDEDLLSVVVQVERTVRNGQTIVRRLAAQIRL